MNNFTQKTDKLKIILSVSVLVILCVIGLAFFARPTVSETEKRELTKFPTFTVEAFLSGEYTSGISLWFSDTFPLREPMIQANSAINQLYGIKGEQVVIKDEADDIPDAPGSGGFNPTDDGGGDGIGGLYVNGDKLKFQFIHTLKERNSDACFTDDDFLSQTGNNVSGIRRCLDVAQ